MRPCLRTLSAVAIAILLAALIAPRATVEANPARPGAPVVSAAVA